jgi:hypothetical protein
MERLLKITAGLAIIVLVGCGRIQEELDCQKVAGPEPYSDLQWFGLVGQFVMVSKQEHKDWEQRVDACMRSRGLAPVYSLSRQSGRLAFHTSQLGY